MNTKLDRTICVMLGRPAAGKTTVAHILSKKLGLMYLSSSVAKENLAKEHTLSSCFDEGFRDESYDVIIKAAVHNLDIGVSSVLDASFYKKERRTPLYEAVKDKAAAIIILYCFCIEETETARRIKNRQLNPEFPHNRACTMDVYHHIHAEFKEPRFTEFPEELPVTLVYVNTYTGYSWAKTWRNGRNITFMDLEEDHMNAAFSIGETLSSIAEKKGIND